MRSTIVAVALLTIVAPSAGSRFRKQGSPIARLLGKVTHVPDAPELNTTEPAITAKHELVTVKNLTEAAKHGTDAPVPVTTKEPETVPELTTAKPSFIALKKADSEAQQTEDEAPFTTAELSPEAAAGVSKAEAELGMNTEQAAKPPEAFVDVKADSASQSDGDAPFATAELSPEASGGVAKAEAELDREYEQMAKEAEAAPSFVQVASKKALITTAKPAIVATKDQLRLQSLTLPQKLQLVNPLQSAQQPLQLRNPLL